MGGASVVYDKASDITVDDPNNVFTGTEVESALYEDLQKIGGTMTGHLIIDPSSGDRALTVKKDIYLKAGQKLYFDGA